MAYKYDYEYERSSKRCEKKAAINKTVDVLLDFAALTLLDIVLYYAGLMVPYRILRAVLGLVFVLFIPGYIATYAFFKNEKEIDEIERLALSVGLSISLVVLTVMFSNLALKIPINFQSIVIEILGICGAFYGISRMPALKIPKRTTYLIVGGGLILLILLLDIFYPYLANMSNAPSEQPVEKYYIDELYDKSMTVERFYPQKGISEKITNVPIPPSSVAVFDGKIALLSHYIDNSTAAVGDSFHITYYWIGINETGRDYSVIVDITDAAGKILFKQDHELPVKINPRDVIMEEYDVRVPAIKEGAYLIRVGLSNNATVTSGTFIDSQNRAIIDTINVVKKVMAFSDLYNSSMNVQWFYPQQKLKYNASGITIKTPQVVNFDNSIALLGYSIDKTGIKPGDMFHIIYYWKSLDKVDINYTAFVHFTNSTGNIKFQNDHQMPIKTSLWNAGDIIAEEYDIRVPAIPAGNYTIRLGLYDSSGTKKRMPILFGPADKENRAMVGYFSVY